MARLYTNGFELQSSTTGVELDAQNVFGTGAIAISTSIFNGGKSSLRFNGGTVSQAYATFNFGAATTIVYYRFDLYVAAYPTTNTSGMAGVPILTTIKNGTGNFGYVTLSTTGKLGMADGVGTNVGNQSSPLTLNQWYTVEFSMDARTQPRRLKLRVNGYLVSEGTQAAGSGFAQDQFQIGFCVGGTGTGDGDFYFDNIAVNDESGTSQVGWPGDGKIVHLYPNGAGDNNAFTSQTGGTAGSVNNYTRVDEITPDDATTYNGDNTSGHIDDFTIDDTPSEILSTATIKMVGVGVRYAGASAASEATFVTRIKKVTSGTVSEGTATTPNATTYKTNTNATPNTLPIILYADPDSSAWTKATLDTAQVGYRISTTGTNEVRVSDVWVVVEYTNQVQPITSGDLPNKFRYISVGNGMSRSEGAT